MKQPRIDFTDAEKELLDQFVQELVKNKDSGKPTVIPPALVRAIDRPFARAFNNEMLALRSREELGSRTRTGNEILLRTVLRHRR